MGELIGKTLPLAFGAAISPTVLALALLVLSSTRRPVARGAAYLGGVLLMFGVLTVVGLAVTNHATGAGSSLNPVTRAIDGTIGFLLLLLAVRTVVRVVTIDRDHPESVTQPARPERYTSLWAAFVLGIAMMMSNFSTILLYLPAMREISSSSVDVADKAVVVVMVFVIASLPATLPFMVRVTAPGPSARWFAALHRVVTRYQRQIGIVIEVVFGVYLLVKAL